MSKETQLQRIVRKKRIGFWRGGSIAIHVNGHSLDIFWGNKRGFKRACKQLYEQADDLWPMVKTLKNIKDD